MTRHPILRPGDMLRLGGATHTVAGLDSATVRLADLTGRLSRAPPQGCSPIRAWNWSPHPG
jgi:hypothetical protein